jgi:hypothetical protein
MSEPVNAAPEPDLDPDPEPDVLPPGRRPILHWDLHSHRYVAANPYRPGEAIWLVKNELS